MTGRSTPKTQKQLVAENKDLRAWLREAEETLRAISSGDVDAIVVPGEGGEQLFTLKGADRSYRTLIEDMSEGALTLTMDGVILYANRRVAEMLKTPLEKVIGSTIHTWIAPDSQQILQSLLRKGVDEKRREELAFAASDGTLVPVYLSVSNLLINGMPDSFCLVATDLTEQKRSEAIVASEKLVRELLSASSQSRLALLSIVEDQKQAEAALEDTNRKLETTLNQLSATTQQLWQASKLATMGELVASIAHELNNPLATVGLRAETLLMQIPEDDQKRHSLEVITQEVDRMAALVSNLLQFSHRSHRQVSTVDLREEVANTVEFVHYHLQTRKTEVVRDFANPLPTIQADRQQLRQLFLNLLTNASDAMPEGGKLTVRGASSVLGDAEAVAVEFADTGEGISAESLEKIWDPFFTTKPEGKGTGLGLAICRRIVEEHGGTISIQSQAGHGTTVRIVLPATTSGASG
jgi:two-component system sensor kinase FixL